MMAKKFPYWTALFVLVLGVVFVFSGSGAAQGMEFYEPFDDPALPGWERSLNTEVIDGILRVESPGYALHPGEWGDIEFSVLARRMGEGFAVVNYRIGELGDYAVQIGPGEINLLRSNHPLAQDTIELIPIAEWFTIRIYVIAGEHEVWINDQVVFLAQDPDPLPPGGIALASQGEVAAEFDELHVIPLGDAEPLPEAEPEEPTHTAPEKEERLESPGAEFEIESLVRYSDDMENANFDAVTPLDGSGDYQVVDDGSGNLAAKLTGSVELEMRGAAWPARTWVDYDIILKTKKAGQGTVAYGFRWLTFSPDAPEITDTGYWLENAGGEWSLIKDLKGDRSTLFSTNGDDPVNEWFDLEIRVRTLAGGTQVEVFINSEPLLDHLDTEGLPYGGFAFRTEGTGAELWLDDVEVIEYVDTRYTWTQTGGPEGVHDLGALAVDPRDWRVVYAGGLDSDLFKSTDGGQTWARIGLPNELWTNRFRIIKLAPTDPDIVYVGAGGKHISPLWRSDDGGDTWHWTDVSENEYLPEADTYGIMIDPDDSMHVLFSIGSGLGVVPLEYTGIYETKDGGKSYSQIYTGAFIGPIEVDPDNHQRLLAGSLNALQDGFSIIASTDGGSTWTPSDTGIDGDDIASILFHPDDTSYVYAVATTSNPEVGANIYRSADGGKSWHSMPALPTANAILATKQSPAALVALGFGKISTSADKGETWDHDDSSSCSGGITVLGTDEPNVMYTTASPNILLSKDLGKSCEATSTKGFLSHAILGIGIAPTDPAVVYAATMGGVFVSRDYGETWSFVKEQLYSGVAVNPLDSNTVYLGAVESNEISKSTDGGATWEDVSGPPIEFPGVGTLVIDPNDHETIYAGTGHGPQFGPGGAGLYKSTDGGSSWTRLNGIPDAAVTSIVVYEKDSDIVVASAMGFGFYYSDDAGQTFEVRNQGMTTDSSGEEVSVNIWSLAVDPRDPQVIYAGTVEHSGYGAQGGRPAIYKTTDAGLNWKMLIGWFVPGEYQFLYFGAGVDAMAINPARPDEIYVALHDPGIVFSENGGEDWRFVNHGLTPLMTHVYPYRMAISQDGSVLYATTCGRSLFRNITNDLETALPSSSGSRPSPDAGAAPDTGDTGAALPQALGGVPTWIILLGLVVVAGIGFLWYRARK